jgi:hypothetical protein
MAAAAAADDVLYEDENVCILDPKSKRGVVIFTESKNWNICEEGLLSYNELRKRHPELGLKDRADHIDPDHNDLIFFRAPYNSDTSTFESSYDGKSSEKMLVTYRQDTIVTIRVDPERSFVFSSEIRAAGGSSEDRYVDLQSSRIKMTDYLKKIKGYSEMKSPNNSSIIVSDLITYDTFPMVDFNGIEEYPLSKIPIERNSEVVVKLPHIPPNWFVSCFTNRDQFKSTGGKSKKTHKRKKRCRRSNTKSYRAKTRK